MFEPLKRRIQLLVGKCVISTVASGKYQVELLAGETREDIALKQHFGFKSIPTKNTTGITLSFGGLRDDTIIICTDNSDAPELKEGESCLYNNFTEKIELLEKLINLKGETININGDSKQLVTHAELNSALQDMLSQLNSHTHTTTATVGSSPAPGVISPPTSPSSIDISSSKTTTINVE